MNKIKFIWKNTYLGKLFSTDPMMAKGVSIFLFLYIFVHIFRLEVYPFYMYAMFSKKEIPSEVYNTYQIFSAENEVNFNEWDYRKYTVLMNTVQQYDKIINNKMLHPEANTIDKFVDRLYLSNTGLRSALKENFDYSDMNLKQELRDWLSYELGISQDSMSLNRKSFTWEKKSPQPADIELLIYALD